MSAPHHSTNIDAAEVFDLGIGRVGVCSCCRSLLFELAALRVRFDEPGFLEFSRQLEEKCRQLVASAQDESRLYYALTPAIGFFVDFPGARALLGTLPLARVWAGFILAEDSASMWQH